MHLTPFQEVKDGLRQLYLDDPRPWLVGFSGGKDSTMVAALIFAYDPRKNVGRRSLEIPSWGAE